MSISYYIFFCDNIVIFSLEVGVLCFRVWRAEEAVVDRGGRGEGVLSGQEGNTQNTIISIDNEQNTVSCLAVLSLKFELLLCQSFWNLLL